MYKYFKKLNYPVNVRKKDLRMAKYLITQLGGPAGELGAALRYFSQKFYPKSNNRKLSIPHSVILSYIIPRPTPKK